MELPYAVAVYLTVAKAGDKQQKRAVRSTNQIVGFSEATGWPPFHKMPNQKGSVSAPGWVGLGSHVGAASPLLL